MPLKTTTLPTSRLMKEAGFRQDTIYCYAFDDGYKIGFTRVSLFGQEVFAAPTSDEILEEIPENEHIRLYAIEMELFINKGDILDLFRDPEKLAACWLWLRKERII